MELSKSKETSDILDKTHCFLERTSILLKVSVSFFFHLVYF